MCIQDTFFHEIRCHSFSFMHSFLSDSIEFWNNVGSEFTLLSPISKFKEALFSVICPAKKSVFGIHNLFQLRLGLSQWRSRTKNHSFVDTPSNLCICNLEAENTEHLFCRCSILSIPRLFLVDMVSDIFSQEIIPITNLNGNPSFKVSDTRLILLATIKFITDSNRFVKEDWQYFRLKFFLVYLIYFVLKTIFR